MPELNEPHAADRILFARVQPGTDKPDFTQVLTTWGELDPGIYCLIHQPFQPFDIFDKPIVALVTGPWHPSTGADYFAKVMTHNGQHHVDHVELRYKVEPSRPPEPHLTLELELEHAQQAIRELIEWNLSDTDSPMTPRWYVNTEAAQHAVDRATAEVDYGEYFPFGTCDQCGARVADDDTCEQDPDHETGVHNAAERGVGYACDEHYVLLAGHEVGGSHYIRAKRAMAAISAGSDRDHLCGYGKCINRATAAYPEGPNLYGGVHYDLNVREVAKMADRTQQWVYENAEALEGIKRMWVYLDDRATWRFDSTAVRRVLSDKGIKVNEL